MSETRVQFNTIVSNQLPTYVQEDYPLISQFLKQYYLGQEYQGGPVDLIQNIDKYVKVDETTNLNESALLNGDLDFDAETINVDVGSPYGTNGFPDSYGLLQIDDEVITYTGKTEFSFTGCIRGFVGITSYRSEINKEEVVFKETESDDHKDQSIIKNLSCLFLKEFLRKTKHQLVPGFEERTLTPGLDQNLFIKQSKDFYLSKGTDISFEILFKALYNEDVQIIKPRDFLVAPSDAQYRIVNSLVVEAVEGDPVNLENATLYQDEYKFGSGIKKAYAPITDVERISVGYGQTFYKISFDGGYNRDINVDGSLYGKFAVEPSTRVIGGISTDSISIDVDSTVGFGSTGELYVNYTDTTTGVVSYTSKSLTQFFGITNVTGNISDASTVGVNTFTYGRSSLDQDEIIKVKINSVLSNVELIENTSDLIKGGIVNISTLGCSENNFKTNKWFYNVAPLYKVSKLELLDSSDNTYKITLNVEHSFKSGDSANLITSAGNEKKTSIFDIISNKSFSIKGQGSLDLNSTYKIKRIIQKGVSNVFTDIFSYATDVSNVYKNDSDYLIASPSIPNYDSQPLDLTTREVAFSGTFSGNEFKISPGKEHGFYTGDSVYYSAEIVNENYIDDSGSSATREVRGVGLFADGLYFIKRIDGFTVKFAKSRNDILNSNFVSLSEETAVSGSTIKPYEFNGKELSPQKLLRKISNPIDDGSINKTTSGFTGILVNGVEILNYKSKDVIKYGKIENIEVLARGTNIDVINAPDLIIKDAVGSGATGYVAVSGSFEEIKIVDPGFDYEETPTLKIVGGNGSGALGQVNMKSVNHNANFFADVSSNRVVIGTTSVQSRIGFSTYHKFKNAEQVIYKTSDQSGIVGLVTNSSYFVSTIDNTTVRLHKTQGDAISGINTVYLTSYGIGRHSLQSVGKKLVVDSINIVDGGSGYKNKKRTASAESGISTSSNLIKIENHDYRSGENVKYTHVGTIASGLSTNTEYYVTKVDDNSFNLSQVGSASDREFYYRTKQYVDITSVGVGTHIFNYPDISVSLIGKVGISSVGLETFEAKVQPVVRGEITSVHLENSGVGYGSSDIINLDYQPTITLDSGINAQVQPVLSNGRIVQVIVLNSGSKYFSSPDLIINGDGSGCVLTPIVENGSLISVNVIESGGGYSSGTTSIDVIPSGSTQVLPEFKANIKSWRVNLYQKYSSYFSKDDGIISDGNYGLQYSHLYAPRVLRESIFSISQDGQTLYGESDLKKINGIEEPSDEHSPIIGFAYDGNPIYGPYGYKTKTGGIISPMKSGYKLDLKDGRPSTSIFPEGFFVEDYTHSEVPDDSILDVNNGRFCITPDYPEGTYAYFMTINNDSSSTSGVFEKYREPVFPYIIGENYQSIPNKFNFKLGSNQDSYDIEQNGWKRNTQPLNLIEGDSEYPYLFIPNKLNQTSTISATTPGKISSVGIVTGGSEYRVNEEFVFNNDGTQGNHVSAKISRVKGRPVSNISVASSIIENVEFYPGDIKGEYLIFADNPHNFINLDTISISGLSTTSSEIEGTYSAGIQTNRLTIAGVGSTGVAIGTDGVTGIVTYFRVNGSFTYPNIRENDILSIGTEKVKVLNVDALSSRIRVLRAVEGTTGASHTIGKFIYEDPRKIKINAGFKTDYAYTLNKQIYFDPASAVGLGTTAGVGIGTTISFANPGSGATQAFIPTKSIFIKNHNLNTGDQLIYSPGTGGNGIIVQDETNVGVGTTLSNGQTLFVAKITEDLIGIATVRVGLGTTGSFVGGANTDSSTVFFRTVGTGDTHSFTTNYNVITGNVQRNLVTVSTATTHGLSSPHNVFVSVNPQNTGIVTVKYNDYNSRIIINPIEFATAGVNTSTNTILLPTHGFKTGDKIIHTAITSSEGLENEKIYYIVNVDRNTVKLANTYFNSIQNKPEIIGITSASDGTINPINPTIDLYKNSTVTFDLSDSSLAFSNQGTTYSAFELNLYTDKNLTKVWNTSKVNSNFELIKDGKVGTSGAKATLTVNNDIPQILYYTLDVVKETNVPEVKERVFVDSEVISGNEINAKESRYSGKHTINVGTTTSFTYSIKDVPEESSYGSSSDTSYETDCTHTYGPIAKIEITNSGSNYYSLPGITTVTSGAGNGAILETFGSGIGSVKSISLKDIGFKYPSDKTLTPEIVLPQVISINSLASFDSIGITSFGRGFSIPPKLVVLDGRTNKIVPNVDLKVTVGKSNVEILENTKGMNAVTPTIIPTESGAGVGINSIVYTSSGIATATLSVGFSTVNSFPFVVGDKVLIENVSVGVGSTGKGYNSSAYDYQLFTITATTENLGGIGDVSFDMSEFISSGEIVGTFDSTNSSGKILAQKHFPSFAVELDTNNYIVGEPVTSNSAKGIVDSWNSRIGTLRISSPEKFVVGEIVEGSSSKTQGIASSIKSFDAYMNLDASSKDIKGWQNSTGFLNNDLQKIQDSFYYQNFSYSLKSKVSYSTWEDSVSSLNHTLGFKKFSDYQLETKNANVMSVGLTTNTTNVSAVNHLDGFASLNCVYDFDLVTENNLSQNSKFISNEIVFSNRILTDYFESVGNRVLSIDDISSQFNSNPRPTDFSIVDTFPISSNRFQKYITYIRDKRFVAQRQLMLVDLLHDNSRAYMNQYARVETAYDQGSFDFSITGTDGRLEFHPVNSSVNDYDVSTLSYNLDDVVLGTGSTSLGGVVLIDTDSIEIPSNTTKTIVSIGHTYSSAKVLVNINPDISRNDEYEAIELNIIHKGSDIELLEYGRLATSIGDYSETGLGTYHAYIDGTNLKVDFIPTSVGIATTGAINTVVVGLSSNTFTGIGTINLRRSQIEGRTTTISSSGSPGINTVADYPNNFDGAYFIVQVTDTTNSSIQLSEIVVVDDYVDSTQGRETYMTEYANIETASGLGTFGSRVSAAGTVSLVFTPNASINAVVNVYMNALSVNEDVDLSSQISFTNGSINDSIGEYFGTDNDIKREFELTHENEQIFERYFLGNSSDVVNATTNTIKIPNHFFVSGEKIRYNHVGTASSAIGIATASFVGTSNTTFLPDENLYAVKVDDNLIKIATSAENALKFIPEVVDLESVGIGTSHRFIATNQNAKVIVAIDNVIQSPVVSTAVTTVLADQVRSVDNVIKFSGITSFFGSDIIQIGNEIMKIEGVGIGSTNTIRVRRPWLGTVLSGYGTGTLVTKISGNYNIVDNMLNFVEAPFGNVPIGSTTNPPDERDWTGITTSSSFQGRSFMRSGVQNTSNESYNKNYIFDNISSQFNAVSNEFTLEQNDSNVSGISTENAVILVNDVFQTPGLNGGYVITESSGISSIAFQGTNTVPLGPDVGISSFPKGGIIVSVGSDAGLGYQPLISAGGTAVVSVAGTISSISIGNSGSGYRVGVQTVNVAIKTSSVSESNVVSIGTAVISNGNITSVAISTDRVFYAPRDISNVLYDNASGVTTVTTSTNHGLSYDDQVTLSGIAFTCNYSGSGPVNVSNAIYNNVTGIMTVTTSAPHNLSTTGQKSDVILTGLAFTCGLDGGSSTHVYPRTTDPAYCGSKVTAVNSATQFVINAGVSTVPTFYSSSGVAQPALIAPRNVNNSASGTDPAAEETNVLRVINNTSFEVNTGISTREHFYARCGKVNKPLDVVFDDPLSYSNISLQYSSSSSVGVGTSAVVDIVVGQGSSVIDFTIRNTGYGYGNGEILTVPIGGSTGIPTTSSFSEFKITIDEVFNDKFSGWTIGQLQVLDDINDFIDGSRKDFSLSLAGNSISIVSGKGSKIDVQDVLLIFVNDVLQVPGKGYTFNGGSIVTFTEGLKVGDSVSIMFYKGTGDTDVIFRNIIETVKKGDTLQIKHDASIGQSSSLDEDERVVDLIKSTNIVQTNSYSGPGNTKDVTLERPVVWCRQTEDIFIDQIAIGKNRELYEPVINPSAYITKSVGVGSTAIYVDSLRPTFDSQNENDTDLAFQKKIKFIAQDSKVSAAATAVVTGLGTISTISISNGGSGYSSAPVVTIGSTVQSVGLGTTATATSSITAGVVTSITITNAGTGYTNTSAPVVLIAPPSHNTEEVSVNTYSGDNGVIVGFGTTTVGIGTQLIFDVHIPYDSFLRDSNIAGTALTISSISKNDYFVIKNSNVGSSSTSILSLDTSDSTVGLGTVFADNVYEVDSAVSISTSVSGISTYVRRVFAKVNQFNYGFSGITTSDFFGSFSWGRIDIAARSKENSYSSYAEGSGISTATMIVRSNFLKFKNYDL